MKSSTSSKLQRFTWLAVAPILMALNRRVISAALRWPISTASLVMMLWGGGVAGLVAAPAGRVGVRRIYSDFKIFFIARLLKVDAFVVKVSQKVVVAVDCRLDVVVGH